MPDLPDLLTQILTLLQGKMTIANIAIIDDVDAIPLESGFPAIGIFDGGDEVEQGASESLDKQLIFFVVYAEVQGNTGETVLQVREICRYLRKHLTDPVNFETGGALEGFVQCRYLKSSKVMKMTQKGNDDSFIALKMPLYEFTELLQNA
jgi:hypothetical protein